MFLNIKKSGYNCDGEQFAHGHFLIIFQCPHGDICMWANADGKLTPVPELRCVVRYVRMSQCGHWMMGDVQIGSHQFVISGDYGSDGLPKDLQHTYDTLKPAHSSRLNSNEINCLWNKLHPIPKEIQDAFWNGGGWNCGGNERPLLRKWAIDHIESLKIIR